VQCVMNKLSLCRGAARRDVQTGWGNRSGWSDLRCLLCRSIVQSWNSPLPKPSVGWCSWCFKRCDQVLLKESVFGSDVLTCSSCQHHTRKCTSCSDGFAWGNGILNSLQCAVCVGCVRSWSCLESPAVSEVSAICSWCLQKSFHHLIEKIHSVAACTAAPHATAVPSSAHSVEITWLVVAATTTTNYACNAIRFHHWLHLSSLLRTRFLHHKR